MAHRSESKSLVVVNNHITVSVCVGRTQTCSSPRPHQERQRRSRGQEVPRLYYHRQGGYNQLTCIMKALKCKTLGAELIMHTIHVVGETAFKFTSNNHYFLSQLVAKPTRMRIKYAEWIQLHACMVYGTGNCKWPTVRCAKRKRS